MKDLYWCGKLAYSYTEKYGLTFLQHVRLNLYLYKLRNLNFTGEGLNFLARKYVREKFFK